MSRSSKKTQTAERRRTIADRLRRGLTQVEIAQELGISQPAVSQHLAAIRAAWKEEARQAHAALVEEEYAKLLAIQKTAWESFLKSQQERTITHTERTRDDVMVDANTTIQGIEKVKASVRTEQSHGDPRYLAILLSVHEKIARLFGLEAAKRLEIGVTGNSGREKEMWEYTDEELLAIAGMANSDPIS